MFSEIENGKQPVYEDRYTKYSGGLVNAITGVTVNNGVGFYTTKEGKKVYEDRLTIAKDGEYAGTTYLQTSEFIIAGHSVGLLDNLGVNNNVLLYLASCLNKYKDVGYWRLGGVMGSVTMGRLKETELELPVLTPEDTTPYWDYMAYYIHNIQHQYADQLEAKSEYELNLMCQILGVTREEIVQRLEFTHPQYTNTFRVGDLFEPKLGVNVPKDLILTEGKNRLVSGTTTNNGTIGYIEDDIKGHTYKEGVTVSNRGEYSGRAFYQPTEFILGPNVIYLEPKIRVTQEFLLYIVTLVNKLPYGGYGNYPTKRGIVEDILELPVIAPNTKQIDWDAIRNAIILGGINYLGNCQEICNRDLAIIRQLIQ